MLKKAGKILLVLLSVLIAGFFITALVVALNQEKIKSYLVNELNRQIHARVQVQDISLSLFRKFPHATLWFRDVRVFSSQGERVPAEEPILQAGQVYLVFNVFDLARKNYVIRQLEVRDGQLVVLKTTTGETPIHFLRESSGSDRKELKMQLQDVSLRQMRFKYLEEPGGVLIAGHTDRTSFSGDFFREGMQLQVSTDLILDTLRLPRLESEKQVPVQGDFFLQKSGLVWTVKEAVFAVSGLDFKGSGQIRTGEDKQIELAFTGDKLNIRDLTALLPRRMADRIKPGRSSGLLDVKGRLLGPYGDGERPHFELDFGLQDASLALKNVPFPLRDLSCRGYFTSGEDQDPSSAILGVEQFNVRIGSGSLAGSLTVSRFPDPVFSGGWSGNILLEDLRYLLGQDSIPEMSGRVRSNITFRFHPQTRGAFSLAELAGAELNGNLSLHDLSVFGEGTAYRISGLTGDLLFAGPVWFDNLNLEVNGIPFRLNGRADNLLSYLLRGRETMHLEAEAYSPRLDMDQLFRARKEQIGETNRAPTWPAGIKMDLRFNLDAFDMSHFHAKNATGIFVYEPGMILIPQVSFSGMQGTVSGNALFTRQEDEGIVGHAKAELNGVNIRELFVSFNDFGQQFITSSHLNGKLSGNLGIRGNMDRNWKIDRSSLLAETSFRIDDGELIQFEPMKRLSRFIELEELEHIRFSRLENDILIRDQQVIIPAMDIHSNAFNISATGTHSFDNHFSYRLKVLLSDILARKARKPPTLETEFGRVEEDGLNQTSLFLRIEGTPDDFNVSYDREAVKDAIRQSFREQGKEIRAALQEEFGWNKSDSISPESDRKPAFRIRWEGDSTASSNPVPPPDTVKKKKPLFRIKWEEAQDTLPKKNR